MDDIKFMTGFNIEPVVASETAIAEAIKKNYGSLEDQERKKELEEIVSFIDEGQQETLELEAEDEASLNLEQLEKAAEEAPVIKLVNYLLTDAVKRGASDIHMEPYEREYRVRYRIDGILQTIMSPPNKLRDAIISRVKIMSKLDISEKRLPQDGRIMVRMLKDGKKKQLDLRVSVLPTLHGEKIVMRLLDKENLRLDMTKLGFEPESLAKFQKAIIKALWNGPGDRSNRQRQDQHPLFLHRPVKQAGHQYPDCGRSGRIPIARDQPGSDERADRAELCRGLAGLPAAGSQYHSGGRDPGL